MSIRTNLFETISSEPILSTEDYGQIVECPNEPENVTGNHLDSIYNDLLIESAEDMTDMVAYKDMDLQFKVPECVGTLQMRVKDTHCLHISNNPVSGIFFFELIRANYENIPIDYTENECPFNISGLKVAVQTTPQGHCGAKVMLEQTTKIGISFPLVSSKISRLESETYNEKVHKAKELELRVYDQNWHIKDKIKFQVVAVARKRKAPDESVAPAGSVTPGGMLAPGGIVAPGGMLAPGGILAPGGSVGPAGSVSQTDDPGLEFWRLEPQYNALSAEDKRLIVDMVKRLGKK